MLNKGSHFVFEFSMANQFVLKKGSHFVFGMGTLC